MTPRPLHAGILIVPQPRPVSLDRLGREIDAFMRSRWPLPNRCYEWSPGGGWVPLG